MLLTPPAPRRWTWLLLLPVLAGLHQAAADIPIDRHNLAMQADGSAEAANEHLLREEFGVECLMASVDAATCPACSPSASLK
jgi:hypothetical protein